MICFLCVESGVSRFPCFEAWPGEEGFSEVETQNIRDYVSSLKPVPELTFAMHSAAELLLYPYSWSLEEIAENWEEQVTPPNFWITI